MKPEPCVCPLEKIIDSRWPSDQYGELTLLLHSSWSCFSYKYGTLMSWPLR